MNSLREIQAIKRLAPHPNIVKLEEVLFDPPSGRLALVFELLEGNLYELMKGMCVQALLIRRLLSGLFHLIIDYHILWRQIVANTLVKQL